MIFSTRAEPEKATLLGPINWYALTQEEVDGLQDIYDREILNLGMPTAKRPSSR
jgi:hypothetical protein